MRSRERDGAFAACSSVTTLASFVLTGVIAVSCRPTSVALPEASAFEAVPANLVCVSAGAIASAANRTFRVDAGGMRAEVAGDRSAAAELPFTYNGPSSVVTPLANGEVRRQIGLKLRAQDTCNVLYVMWHIEPTAGVFVSLKRNVGASKHAECRDGGYTTLQPRIRAEAPAVVAGAAHVLRAEIDAGDLVVSADGAVVWRGELPPAALAIVGPVGIRTDNGAFDVELRVPGGARSGAACVAR